MTTDVSSLSKFLEENIFEKSDGKDRIISSAEEISSEWKNDVKDDEDNDHCLGVTAIYDTVFNKMIKANLSYLKK